MGDDLGQHRVEAGADHGAGDEARVHPDAGAGRSARAGRHGAGRGQEAAVGVLGVDAGLDGMAVEADLRPGSSGSGAPAATSSCHSTRSMPVTASVTGCSTWSRVFISMNHHSSGRSAGHDELHRPGAHVAHGPGGGDGGIAHGGAGGGVEEHRRRLLHDLLVPSLQGALALAEVHRPAVAVGDDLHLDVAGGGHPPLDEQGVVTEGHDGLPARRRYLVGEVGGVGHPAHALAATASGRFDQDGEPDVERSGDQGSVVVVGGVDRTGHHRDASRRHGRLGPDLVAHGVDRRRRGPDPHQPGCCHGAGEGGPLGQEPVARVHRSRPGGHRGAHHILHREVAADAHGLVGLDDMGGVAVGVGVDGHRGGAEEAEGAEDPPGDLAPVGDEHRSHGRRHILNTPKDGASSGALAAAARARPSTVRVLAGSMTPSSQSRAVE